jgi:hypothetical protein
MSGGVCVAAERASILYSLCLFVLELHALFPRLLTPLQGLFPDVMRAGHIGYHSSSGGPSAAAYTADMPSCTWSRLDGPPSLDTSLHGCLINILIESTF